MPFVIVALIVIGVLVIAPNVGWKRHEAYIDPDYVCPGDEEEDED